MPNHHLLCNLSLSLFLLLFFFSFFSFFSFHTVHSAFSTTCDPVSSSSKCGNISIQYPFWTVSDAPVHCGYPGFGLSCSNGSDYPTLSLPGDTYFVTEVNYVSKTLTLVNIDVTNQRCPRARRNLTFGSLPLGYNSTNSKLTFFFNCSALAKLKAIDCLRFGDNQSYVLIDRDQTDMVVLDEALDCQETVVAVVKGAEVTAANVVDVFASAMSQGFVLDWKVAKKCRPCEHSDGRCAFNRAEHVKCFCHDGSNHSDGSFCKGRNEVPVYTLPFLRNGFCILFAGRHGCLLDALTLFICCVLGLLHNLKFRRILESRTWFVNLINQLFGTICL